MDGLQRGALVSSIGLRQGAVSGFRLVMRGGVLGGSGAFAMGKRGGLGGQEGRGLGGHEGTGSEDMRKREREGRTDGE